MTSNVLLHALCLFKVLYDNNNYYNGIHCFVVFCCLIYLIILYDSSPRLLSTVLFSLLHVFVVFLVSTNVQSYALLFLDLLVIKM